MVDGSYYTMVSCIISTQLHPVNWILIKKIKKYKCCHHSILKSTLHDRSMLFRKKYVFFIRLTISTRNRIKHFYKRLKALFSNFMIQTCFVFILFKLYGSSIASPFSFQLKCIYYSMFFFQCLVQHRREKTEYCQMLWGELYIA